MTKLNESGKFVVLGDENSHEFDLHIESHGLHSRTYSLFASNNGIWSEDTRGKLLLKMTDTGNEIIFDKARKKLDYSIASYMRILLNVSIMFDEYKINYSIAEQNVLIKF